MPANHSNPFAEAHGPRQELTPEQRAILDAVPILNVDAVRHYVASKWPAAMQSPLAQAMHGASSMAQLEASDAERTLLLADARNHAQACMRARGGWTVETLGHNIESAFGDELSPDECDDIAREALGQ